MPTDELIKMSIPVLRRLPIYHHYISNLSNMGTEFVSSGEIAEHLNIDPIQVRKDLAVTGAAGKPKLGFAVSELLEKIETFLGWRHFNEAVLVGCGSLGSAIIGYDGFKEYGFEIAAAFDVNEKILGKKIHNKPVLHINKLPDLCQRLHISIGLITVPAHAAQQTADMMIAGGIKAIWNFAPAAINVPKDIILQQENLLGSLAILIKQLQSQYPSIGKK